MKLVKTKGIIIAENNSADFDKMLTILTPNLGKIECMAKGARRPKSALISGAQFLCFSDYILYKAGNAYLMNSCEVIDMFYDIRVDLEKLNVATYITKIINDVTTENQNNYKVLQLFLNTLYVINKTDKDIDFILSIFKMRLLAIIGFKPFVGSCKICDKKEELTYFSFKDNCLKCNECGKLDKGAVEISETTKDAIRYIIMADAKKIYSFNIPQESINELKIISNIYLNEKLEKEYKLEKFTF